MPEDSSPKRSIKPIVEEIVAEQPQPVEHTAVQEVPVQQIPQPQVNQTLSLQPPPAPMARPKRTFHLSIGFVVVVVVIALIVALVSGALYVYFNGVNGLKGQPQTTPEATIQPTPVPKVTPLPSATPEVMLKLDSYKISVLNGSGKPGEAGNAKDLLEKAGFKVASTGNADNFSFKSTQIQAKTSVSAQAIVKAKEALSDSYTVEQGTALNDKSSFDIIVTVGAK